MPGPEKQFYDAQQETAALASGAANDDDDEDDADSGAAGSGRRGFKSGGSGLVRYSGSGGEGRSTSGNDSGFVEGNVATDPNAQRLNKVCARRNCKHSEGANIMEAGNALFFASTVSPSIFP